MSDKTELTGRNSLKMGKRFEPSYRGRGPSGGSDPSTTGRGRVGALRPDETTTLVKEPTKRCDLTL